MSSFYHRMFQKQWRRIYIAVLIPILACLIYFYYYPVAIYPCAYRLDGIHSGDNEVLLQIAKAHRQGEIGWNNDGCKNGDVIIDVKIDTEKTNIDLNGWVIFYEYRLPFLFTLSTTPIIYGTRKNDSDKNSQYAYYDRIKKKMVFVVKDKTIEITHKGKFLVYNGVSIVIDENSKLNINIDKDGIMSVEREYNNIYYPLQR